MQNEITVLTKDDNMFDYFGDELTTVALALESIYFHDSERKLSAENKASVLALDNIHYYNDDLFNLLTNEVLTKEDILTKYNIKCFDYDLKLNFTEPQELSSLSIMEVFEYDLKRSA